MFNFLTTFCCTLFLVNKLPTLDLSLRWETSLVGLPCKYSVLSSLGPIYRHSLVGSCEGKTNAVVMWFTHCEHQIKPASNMTVLKGMFFFFCAKIISMNQVLRSAICESCGRRGGRGCLFFCGRLLPAGLLLLVGQIEASFRRAA